METLPDYYQLLHVQPDAPAPVIKASYRAMMQKMRHHPDLGGDEALAQRLNEAVNVLCDPVRREEYDRLLAVEQGNTRRDSQTNESAHPGGTPRPAAGDDNVAGSGFGTGSGTNSHNYGQTQRPPGAGSSARAEERFRQGAPANEPNHSSSESYLPTRAHCPFCRAPYGGATSAERRYPSPGYSASTRCVQCHGASTPIGALSVTTSDDLRRMYRHHHDAPVELWTQWPNRNIVHATMVDLSLSGCAIVSKTQLANGLIIVLDTPILNSVCQIRYCHQHDNHYALGLKFMTLDIQAQPGAVFSTTA